MAGHRDQSHHGEEGVDGCSTPGPREDPVIPNTWFLGGPLWDDPEWGEELLIIDLQAVAARIMKDEYDAAHAEFLRLLAEIDRPSTPARICKRLLQILRMTR